MVDDLIGKTVAPLVLLSLAALVVVVTLATLCKAVSLGIRRLFVNTKDECVLTWGKLSCSYATGHHRLIELMNRLRSYAIAL